MKVQIKPNKSTIVELDGETQKDLFEQMASAYEVFGERCCGLCGCEDIVPFWRVSTKQVGKKTEEYEYPEWHCRNPKCRARLTLSFNLEGGTMFPNRKLLPDGQPATGEKREQGQHGPHNGWTRWWPKKEE